MINLVKVFGLYIVIIKYVVFLYVRLEVGLKEIVIGIVILDSFIEFGNNENDFVKYVFCLSVIDNNSYLCVMFELVELLEEDEFFKVLDSVKEVKEIIDFIKIYEL